MIEIPLYYFFFGYALFVLVFVIFYFIILYHIVQSASFTFASFLTSFFIVASTVLIFYATFGLLSDVDWQTIVLSIDVGFQQSLF